MERWQRSIAAYIKENPRAVPASGVILILALLIIIRWGYGYHTTAQREIASSMERYKALQSVLIRGEELTYLKKSNDERLMALEAGLLKADKPTVAAAELEEAFKAISSKKGITITSEKALTFTSSGMYTRVPVEFEFKARLPQVKELLYEIERSPVLMGVRSLRIKVVDARGPGNLEVSIVIEGAIRKRGI